MKIDSSVTVSKDLPDGSENYRTNATLKFEAQDISYYNVGELFEKLLSCVVLFQDEVQNKFKVQDNGAGIKDAELPELPRPCEVEAPRTENVQVWEVERSV